MLRNFSWLIEDEIAGMGRPLTLTEDLFLLKKKKINTIVSLTEKSLDRDVIESSGFLYLHLPIVDFSVPSFEQIDVFLDFVSSSDMNKKKTVLHCESGFGRTGTMLSIYLVKLKGYSADDAIRTVRMKRPGSVETPNQEARVFEFAKRI